MFVAKLFFLIGKAERELPAVSLHSHYRYLSNHGGLIPCFILYHEEYYTKYCTTRQLLQLSKSPHHRVIPNTEMTVPHTTL